MSGAPNGGGQQSPTSSGADDLKPSPTKRKHDGDGLPQPRAKRNRYISIACNECKRRKIKCNGETPCQRCGNLSLDCVYAPNCCSNGFKDSDEYRQMTTHLQSLQDQINSLFATVTDLQNKPVNGSIHVNGLSNGVNGTPNGISGLAAEVAHTSTAVDTHFPYAASVPRSQSEQNVAPVPGFAGAGPTAFYLDQTTDGIRALGMDLSGADDGHTSKPMLSTASSGLDGTEASVSPDKDPLWNLTLNEALRLCGVYSELFGMYVVVDVANTTKKARTMCNFLDSMRRVGLMKKESERGDSFCDNETLVLKMVLALATCITIPAEREFGESLYQNVRRIVNVEDRMGGEATIVGLQLWVLIAMYDLKIGAAMHAYRMIGLASRQCFEMGLHRHEILNNMFDTPEALRDAIRLFWIIYVFDNRLSAKTGLPTAIRDADLDPHLPQVDAAAPFCRTMLGYCKIASRIMAPVAGFENTGMELKLDEMSWIDWQISQWFAAVPDELRFTHLDFAIGAEEMTRTQKQIRVEFYLRGNQLRLQLYRPVFYSQASTLENRGYAQTAVEIAKDNIRTLSEMDKATDLYREEQLCFHDYVIQAFGVLFLSVAQAPVEFARQVRDEFFLAIELLKAAPEDSVAMQRLARTVANCKEKTAKLEMVTPSRTGPFPLPNGGKNGHAATPMVGLGDRPSMDTHTDWSHSPPRSVSPTGERLAAELLEIFEVACGFGEAILSKHEAMLMSGMDATAAVQPAGTLDSFAAMWRNLHDPAQGDADFAKAIKDVL